LKKDTPLKILDLSYNRLEDDGANLISEALMFTNMTLEKLSLKYNNIKSEGLCSVFESLDHNKTLTHLYVWGNHFDEPASIVK
jgi:Ran GTPase-activating protein (RanGAP) involved in mRNA processing and transport